MEERKHLEVPTVSYRQAKTKEENREKVEAAYAVLFEEVLKTDFPGAQDDRREA